MAVPNRAARWALALAAGSAVLVAAAACGGSSSATTGAGQRADDPASRFAAYADCLRKQGISVPDSIPTARPSRSPRPGGSARPTARPTARPSVLPSPGASRRPRDSEGPPGRGFGGLRPSGVDEETWQKALQACRSALPSGGLGRGPNAGRSPNGGRGTDAAYATCLSDHGVRLAPGLDAADPKVADALRACRVLSPAPTPAAS